MIDTVQADGHELEYIMENFRNIPTGPAVVQKWTGGNGAIHFRQPTLLRRKSNAEQQSSPQQQAAPGSQETVPQA